MSVHFDRRALLGGIAAATAFAATAHGRAKPMSFFKRINRPIGLQLYTLGDEPMKDLDGVLGKLASIGYHDLELPSLFGKKPAELKAAADKAGVSYSSIHLAAMASMAGGDQALSLVSPTQKIVDDLGALGVKSAVMPILLIPDNFREAAGNSFQEKIANALKFSGADTWKRTAALLNEKAAALKPHGIDVGYHNHNLEFAPIGKTTGFEMLARETDPKLVHFEVDIGWVAAAGVDPVQFLKRHAGRVRWLHVKDLKPTTKANFALNMDPTEVGSGKQDWASILPAAAQSGVKHFYVEQEPPFARPRMEAAATSFAYLDALKA